MASLSRLQKPFSKSIASSGKPLFACRVGYPSNIPLPGGPDRLSSVGQLRLGSPRFLACFCLHVAVDAVFVCLFVCLFARNPEIINPFTLRETPPLRIVERSSGIPRRIFLAPRAVWVSMLGPCSCWFGRQGRRNGRKTIQASFFFWESLNGSCPIAGRTTIPY